MSRGFSSPHEVGNLTFAEVCNPGDSPMDCIKAAACAPSCFAALVSYEDNVAYDAPSARPSLTWTPGATDRALARLAAAS
jgi:hypothetical protein